MTDERDKSPLPGHLQTLLQGTDLDIRETLSKTQRRVSKGRLGRALKLSRLAASSGSKILAQKAKQKLSNTAKRAAQEVTQRAVALEMLETFSEMRGVAMKLGQMLSYLEDMMPPEAQKVLAVLQRDAPAVEWSLIREQFIEEFGKPPEECFAEFDVEPIAAASIGQVHRARLHDGTRVAVKIQYPGIAEAMEADLKNAKLMSIFQRLFFFRTNVPAIMGEIESRLLDECDYRKEAAYQKAFAQRFDGHPHILVPEVHDDYSTKRVLTTSFYEGQTFYQWLESQPSAEERQRTARLFYRFYLGSFYMDGLFNCDPHPGNYLFQSNGKIVFLDYGCTRKYSSERRRLWINMCKSARADERELLEKTALEAGFIKEGVDYDYEAFRVLIRYLYQSYLVDTDYDFASLQPKTTFRQMFVDNPNIFKMDMPADCVFLNRITFGLASLLTEMKGRVNCYQMCQSYFTGIDPHWPEDPFRGKLEAVVPDFSAWR